MSYEKYESCPSYEDLLEEERLFQKHKAMKSPIVMVQHRKERDRLLSQCEKELGELGIEKPKKPLPRMAYWNGERYVTPGDEEWSEEGMKQASDFIWKSNYGTVEE